MEKNKDNLKEKLNSKYPKGLKLHLTIDEAKIVKSGLEKYMMLDNLYLAIWHEWSCTFSSGDNLWFYQANAIQEKIPGDIEFDHGYCDLDDLNENLKLIWELEKENIACNGTLSELFPSPESRTEHIEYLRNKGKTDEEVEFEIVVYDLYAKKAKKRRIKAYRKKIKRLKAEIRKTKKDMKKYIQLVGR